MLDQLTTAAVGSPVYRSGEVGYVTAVSSAPAGVFSIGGGGLQRVTRQVEVCFPGQLMTVPESIAAPWLDDAARIGAQPINAEEAAGRAQAAKSAREAAHRTAQADQAEAAERARIFNEEAAAKTPAWAKAVIVAELHQDDSDSMSDYHGHKTLRTVILAWSAHTRDLFPEMRKAALNSPETMHLADAPEKAEHREKYSMGGGFYLKNGWRDSSGWMVRKVRFYGDSRHVPFGEWSLPVDETIASAVAAIAPAGDGFTLSEHTHTTKGFQMWIAQGPRVEREEYDRLLAAAKALGGWYARPWNGTPGGFAFKDKAKALQFIGGGKDVKTETAAGLAALHGAPPKVVRAMRSHGGQEMAAKLRTLADGMADEIAHKFAERRTNTPKQQREAQSAVLDGYRLQRTQQGLRALADHHEAGTVPAELVGVKTKAAAFDLARAEMTSRGGYYDAGAETGKPAVQTPAALAFWSLCSGRSAEERAADDLRRKVDDLKFANIPGYFPTPAPVIFRMFEAANIPPGQPVAILEPEAGSGAILDQARHRCPAASLVAYERHASLAAILTAKGYALAGSDFMESTPAPIADYVLMNPPFENGQDADHVRHAFAMLRPGGRLVAIVSPGLFYRQGKRETAFREWFEALGGEREDIPAGAFKASGTDMATCMITVDA